MKRFILSLLTIFIYSTVIAQIDWAQYARYAASNDSIKHRPKAVLIGNSITDNWAKLHPEFFHDNNFVGRGISGQVTSQMLCRFQADVIALQPKIVIIMAGTNDIAQNNGYITLEHILQNIQSMCQLAKQNHIRPVLCSCLPAAAFKWRPDMKPAHDIIKLNEMIETYAKSERIKYIDYHSALKDEKGGLPVIYAKDGVHPNLAGYKIMENILLKQL